MAKYDDMIKQRRDLLKSHDYEAIPQDEWWKPDQMKGIDPPPLEKPFNEEVNLIDLVDPINFKVGKIPLIDAIRSRASERAFTDESLTVDC